jgi:hypothetical protein
MRLWITLTLVRMPGLVALYAVEQGCRRHSLPGVRLRLVTSTRDHTIPAVTRTCWLPAFGYYRRVVASLVDRTGWRQLVSPPAMEAAMPLSQTPPMVRSLCSLHHATTPSMMVGLGACACHVRCVL